MGKLPPKDQFFLILIVVIVLIEWWALKHGLSTWNDSWIFMSVKNCPNCGHALDWHTKSGCTAGDRSWTCGCKSTKFRVSELTPKERVIYDHGKQAGINQQRSRQRAVKH